MKRPKSRSKRWQDACFEAECAISDIQEAIGRLETACSDLNDVRSEYEEWQGNLPENLQSSALGEKLQAVVDLDIESITNEITTAVDAASDLINEASGLDLPQGFGRD